MRACACKCARPSLNTVLTTARPTPLTDRIAIAAELQLISGGGGLGPVDRDEELEVLQWRHAPSRQQGLLVGVHMAHDGMEGSAFQQQALRSRRGMEIREMGKQASCVV